MDIRYVSSDQDQQTNAILSEVAERAAREGIRLAGTVQPVGPEPQQKCEIVLHLLPDGPLRSISMDLGPGATGCRLDAGALEEAVIEVHDRLPMAQALVVNKFGKQEAAGRGLVEAIGRACAAGQPVLVGVAPEWRAAFLAFAGGAAQPLEADAGLVMDWLRAACRAQAA
ncbi:DUF2478 domain-containing protein [Pseudogemmobacter humi]|uniref:3-dehydroquinate dehydratase n=1 Tax=Pseudogemmobacter humi TaxID=2483812 RepID=A0A3P5XPC3_9RHOB|nr:DUF2478 domain-containing protein [Pseudogemmobacter humi]VDC30622.1 hypothetical protein XINFAN_02607 [Pseudogemmobacter humi]